MKHLSDLIRCGQKVVYVDVSQEKSVSPVMNHVNNICSYYNVRPKQSIIFGVDNDLNGYKILRVELSCPIDPRRSKSRIAPKEIKQMEEDYENTQASDCDKEECPDISND